MASHPIHNAISAEQLMLSKMEAIQSIIQPEPAISANPFRYT